MIEPAAPHLRPLARGGVAALAALFAIAAVGSGLDRIIAEARPASPAAESVPAWFADASLRRSAAIELSEGRFASAADLARKATLRSPLEPTSTGLLGAARLGTGDPAKADAAFRVSGQLGWRDAVTQTYWMRVALLVGDYPVAAQRLDALLRQQPERTDQADLLAPFESNAAGRAVLSERLAQDPGWTSNYFNPIRSLGKEQLAQRALVATLLGRDHPLGCGGIGRFVRRLIAEEAVIAAHALWQLHCPSARGERIADPDLTNLFGNDPSPFGWENHSDGSVNIRRVDSGGGLVIENTAPFARNFARQMLVLPPGIYRLSWRATEANGEVSRRIEALAGCGSSATIQIDTEPVSGTRVSGQLRITDACEGQILTFRITPGGPGLEFGNIRLEPLNR